MNLMNKLMKKRKMNNKGFSLVELIIVIAIMAILVGIVGTQVVPYIEKSRKAKDEQILSGYCTDAMSAFSSSSAKLDPTKKYEINITPAGAATVQYVGGGTGADTTALQSAFRELNGLDGTTAIPFGSKAGKSVTGIKITCQNASPMITVSVAPTGTFDDIKSN